MNHANDRSDVLQYHGVRFSLVQARVQAQLEAEAKRREHDKVAREQYEEEQRKAEQVR